jgi:dihydropteroate synthase
MSKHVILFSRGQILDISKPVVMGIINVNSDSFYAQSRLTTPDAISVQALRMVREGASIIDLGVMTSKPGSEISNPKHEIKVLTPIVKELISMNLGAWLSVDTVHAMVAEEMLHLGVHMINDISSGSIDDQMLECVAAHSVPYVMMHMQGLPKTMQDNPKYDDVTTDVLSFFAQNLPKAQDVGIHQILVDVGFGFGKTMEHNFELLRNLKEFKILEKPILVGVSRKSFIYKTLATDANHALNGTTAVHMMALERGANILRVHDVKEAIECITLYNSLGVNP